MKDDLSNKESFAPKTAESSQTLITKTILGNEFNHVLIDQEV